MKSLRCVGGPKDGQVVHLHEGDSLRFFDETWSKKLEDAWTYERRKLESGEEILLCTAAPKGQTL